MEIKKINTGTRKFKGILNIRDVWYDTNSSYKDADVVYYMNVEKPVGKIVSKFYTLLIDLSLDKEKLLKEVRKKTKYEINFADKKDNLIHEVFHKDSVNVLEDFKKDFKLFSDLKKISGIDHERVNLYQSLGVLTLTRVLDKYGNTIVWHVYRTNQERAMLLYSATMGFRNNDKKLIGRSNRLAHWKEITMFKRLNIKYYDMGGWYHKDDKPELLGVNKFKESFGGYIVKGYLCIDFPTFKGKLVYLAKKLQSVIRK